MDRQGHTDIDNKDDFQVWLDGCYPSWKKSHYWALQIALVIVWLPAVLHLLNLALQGKLDPMVQVDLTSWLIQLQWFSPLGTLLVAVGVATAAASCFNTVPDLQSSGIQRTSYMVQRKFTRKVAYSWLFKLMFLPNIASYLICYSILWFPSSSNPIPSYRWVYLLASLLVLTLSCWIGAEFSQFMNLKFNATPVWTRVSVVIIAVVIYIALVSFDHLIFGQNPSGAMGILEIVYGWILVLTPLGGTLYMMLATRKPTAPMLEQL